jgi:hypothetical protein
MLRYAAGADALPERLLEATARELCRLRRTEQCATLFARWQLDRPGSPRLKRALAEMRQANRASSRDLAPSKLKQLRMLYDGRVPNVKQAALAEQAERLTDRFLLHYHHAVPFDRWVVEAAWLRCRGNDCEDRQREAWQHLSSLDGQIPDLSESAAPRVNERTEPAWDAKEENGLDEDDPHFDNPETH